jgi:hypothetical protein
MGIISIKFNVIQSSGDGFGYFADSYHGEVLKVRLRDLELMELMQPSSYRYYYIVSDIL